MSLCKFLGKDDKEYQTVEGIEWIVIIVVFPLGCEHCHKKFDSWTTWTVANQPSMFLSGSGGGDLAGDIDHIFPIMNSHAQ
jgi:hypothetical protein